MRHRAGRVCAVLVIVAAVLMGTLGVLMYQRNAPVRNAGSPRTADVIRIRSDVACPDPSRAAQGRLVCRARGCAGNRSWQPRALVDDRDVSTADLVRLPDVDELSCAPDLRLRRHSIEDLDDIVTQATDPVMQRWTVVPIPYARSDAEEFLGIVQRGWQDSRTAAFAIEYEGRFAGTVDLRLQEARWAEVGYGLTPAARGRGVMTRALRRVLEWGFTDLGLAGAHWRANVGNVASWRVAHACGFRMDGTVRGLLVHRGQRVDGWIGSLLAGELL
jgi:RimJ/RimL family protein N-acetyltransferase